jgi:LacI family transcriptional regulator
MFNSIARIAFVAKRNSATVRRLASGLSQFAKPANGFILREFVLGSDATELPPTFRTWSPDAVVSYIASDQKELLAELAACGRPLVSTSRIAPFPNCGVVLGNADEVFDAVYQHFHEIGVTEVVRFALGEESFSGRERYRRYTETRGVAFRTFVIPDPEELDDFNRMKQVDKTVSEWLHEHPWPVGIFSQHDYAGGYVCRACELLGISVPRDVAVIGADGFDAALNSRPSLTTVRVPCEEIGFEAGKLAAAMLGGAPAPTEIIRVSGAKIIARGSTHAPRRSDCNVDAAMAFIFRHACEGIRVNDVVSHTQSVSRMTFHTRFVETFGLTPGEAIRERQLSEARRLASETELSFGAIARMCGFCDYAHFYRAFSDAEGVGPSAYRQALLRA